MMYLQCLLTLQQVPDIDFKFHFQTQKVHYEESKTAKIRRRKKRKTSKDLLVPEGLVQLKTAYDEKSCATKEIDYLKKSYEFFVKVLSDEAWNGKLQTRGYKTYRLITCYVENLF